MGCDIHTMAEVRRKDYSKDADENGNYPYRERWSAITADVFENPYFIEKRKIDEQNTPYTSIPYSGRNYDLFAVLADVRNGYGFAGSPTGDRIEPIADPRGVPDDASKRWVKYVERWGADLHSTSYFTLAELEAAMPLLTQHQRKTGVLSEREYLRVRDEGGLPQQWSGGVGGGGIRVVSVEEYEAGERAEGQSASDPIPPDGPFGFGGSKTYVQYVWETTLAGAAGYFIDTVMPALERVAPRIGKMTDAENQAYWETGVDPRPADKEAVRLVFGFDN